MWRAAVRPSRSSRTMDRPAFVSCRHASVLAARGSDPFCRVRETCALPAANGCGRCPPRKEPELSGQIGRHDHSRREASLQPAPYPSPVSMAWPKVCPKFKARARPSRARPRHDFGFDRDRAHHGAPMRPDQRQQAIDIRSIQSKNAASRIKPCLMTRRAPSAARARQVSALSCRRRPAEADERADQFFPSGWLMRSCRRRTNPLVRATW